MPPLWLPLAAILAVSGVSAFRIWSVERANGVKAFSFGRHAAIQGVAERNWKLAVLLALAFAAMAWLAPDWEARSAGLTGAKPPGSNGRAQSCSPALSL